MHDQTQQVADLLRLMANPGRLAIINLLRQEGPLNVTALKNRLGMEQSLVSHHLIKMRDVGILASTRRGKEISYELVNPTVLRVLNIVLNQ